VHGINSLAYMLSENGREAEAVDLMRHGVHIVETAYGADNIATAREREGFASVLWRAGRVDDAEAIFRDVLDHKRRLLGEWTVPGILLNLSYIAEERGDLEEAERHIAEALRIQRDHDMPSPSVARTLRRMGDVRIVRGVYPAAERALLEALALAAAPPSREQDVKASYVALSRLYETMGREDRAAVYLSLAQGEEQPPTSGSH
jgi:tetratricopeptide (TPR) repeat protein